MANQESDRERLEFEVRMDRDADDVGSQRETVMEAVRLAGGSPPAAQVQFLRELIDDPQEASKFLGDPKSYAVDHGVLLEPAVVQGVVNAVIFDVTIPAEFIEKLGPSGSRNLFDLRANSGLAAIPLAVAAGAAAVAAAAAVVEAVVTVVRTKIVGDFRFLKGLGPNGITMPSGDQFRF